MALLWNCDSFLLNRALQKFLLAQKDSTLQLFLEVWAYALTSDVLDPQPQLLFFLEVILLSNLGGWRGQRSRVTKGEKENCMHSFSLVAIFHTRPWETTRHFWVSSTRTKMINQSGKTDRFVDNLVFCLYIRFHSHSSISMCYTFFNLPKNTCTHRNILFSKLLFTPSSQIQEVCFWDRAGEV